MDSQENYTIVCAVQSGRKYPKIEAGRKDDGGGSGIPRYKRKKKKMIKQIWQKEADVNNTIYKKIITNLRKNKIYFNFFPHFWLCGEFF